MAAGEISGASTPPPPLTTLPTTNMSTPTPAQSSDSSPSKPRHRRKQSLIDELLPLPTPSQAPRSLTLARIARRTGSVAVLSIFLISISFLALTTGSSTYPKELKSLFGLSQNVELGITHWVSEDASVSSVNTTGHKDTKIDFEQYKMFQTLKAKDFDITSPGKRLIFIGDVHGSYEPLKRLMEKLDHREGDKIVHVGDLVAKGKHNPEVLEWMKQHDVIGVRGNHDQPVIQWRTWMEWAGGSNWEDYVDTLDHQDDDDLIDKLKSRDKLFPKHWKWKSEHWKIAREITKSQYKYLLDLPLALHIPSLHSFVVHAGLLPHNPLKSLSDPSQPLEASQDDTVSIESSRLQEELSLLLDIPQNANPWNLINMRSIFTKGKTKGKITKSTKKGTPWSDIWQEEMSRCKGREALDLRDEPSGEVDALKKSKDLSCSPVTVIYGHAAARGLDIKDFSKGIDTGCVYGRSLTALVLGDTSGLEGDKVSVSGHEGLLVSVECKKGGK